MTSAPKCEFVYSKIRKKYFTLLDAVFHMSVISTFLRTNEMYCNAKIGISNK